MGTLTTARRPWTLSGCCGSPSSRSRSCCSSRRAASTACCTRALAVVVGVTCKVSAGVMVAHLLVVCCSLGSSRITYDYTAFLWYFTNVILPIAFLASSVPVVMYVYPASPPCLELNVE